MNNRNILKVLGLLLFSCCLIFPIIPGERKSNILVATAHGIENIDKDYAKTINEGISEKLGESGFNVIVIENYKDRNELLQTAEWMEASYIIESAFQVDKSKMEWEINGFSLLDNIVLFTSFQKFKPDVLTKRLVGEIIEKYIVVLQKNINPPNIEPSVEEIKPFEIQAGVAPFIAIGDFATYSKLGFDAHLYTGYRFYNSEYLHMTLGANCGFSYFRAKGVLDSSHNYLITLGPEFRLGTDINTFMNLYFRISPGASLFAVKPDRNDMQIKIIPYISTGIGSDIYFSQNIGFSIIISYSLYLEGSTLIHGFVPGTSFNIRF